jgi:hypothetical protein
VGKDSGQEIIVTVETGTRLTLRQRTMHELKEFAFLTLYLYATLGAVILMKAAVLHAEGIDFTPWGVAIVKAAVLAKFMLLGNALKVGERSGTAPLIWPTLHKAVGLLLLLVLTIIEDVVAGFIHGRSITASLSELLGPRLWETLANILIMLMVLIPYCAFRALGEGRLTRMFFVAREPVARG